MTVSERHDEKQEGRVEIGPGAQLKAERVGRGMGLGEVASTLHVPASVIEKLEADDYEGLPPDTFTRGCLRAYARLLELDPEPLLARYPGGAALEQRPLRVSAPVKTSPDITPGLLKGFLGGGVLAVLVGLGVWFYSLDEADEPMADAQLDAPPVVSESPTPSAVAGDEPGTVDVDSQADLADEPDQEQRFTDDLAGPRDSGRLEDTDGERAAAADAADETPPAGESDVAQPEAGPTAPSSDEPAGPLDAEVLAQAEQAAREADTVADTPPPASASDRGEELELEFSGPSWVEVYDADGERLMYGLIQDRGRERLRGNAPFSVVIGDANHVALHYQGEPVDLGQIRPGRVVRTNVPN